MQALFSEVKMNEKLYYYPEIFSVQNEQAARAIILTPEGPGADTDTRWMQETPFITKLLQTHLAPGPGDLILDYGCGIGRLAKELIQHCGCHVIGVDISPEMRRLSLDYVASPLFTAVSPEILDSMIAAGLRVNGAFSIWVLQHCYAPDRDIEKIKTALRDDGKFFVINMPQRAIPVRRETTHDDTKSNRFDWSTDGVNVRDLLTAAFTVTGSGDIDHTMIPHPADVGAYWMSLTK